MKWAAFVGALAIACATDEVKPAPAPAPQALVPWSDDWLAAEGKRYLSDAAFRRRALEESLTNKDNVYSRTRITGYGLKGEGWDLLPQWIPKTLQVDDTLVQHLRNGGSVRVDRGDALWDGKTPSTMAQWIRLGRRVFFEYPLRSEVFAEHTLRSQERALRVGLAPDRGGTWPGLVAFETLDGDAEIGITCALCHVAIEDGQMVEGRARRNFDYGELRLSFYRDTGAFLPEEIKRRMATWGPGRADITQDEEEDPVAIVDLWGVRDRAYLTQSGTLKQQHPAALAIRQETQLLQANHELARPPRELAWALAMYIYSLKPPPLVPVADSPESVAQGRKLFEESCRGCHSDRSYSGTPIPAAAVGTDPVLALGSARGTGLYRPAPLIRVAESGPYLHDGSVATLENLFDPEREEPGHRYGTDWPENDKRAILAFLGTL